MAAYAKAQSTHRIFAGLNLVFEKNNIRIQAASKLAMAMGNQQLMWLFNGKPRFSISISVRFSC
jgi:hypothetical protein